MPPEAADAGAAQPPRWHDCAAACCGERSLGYVRVGGEDNLWLCRNSGLPHVCGPSVCNLYHNRRDKRCPASGISFADVGWDGLVGDSGMLSNVTEEGPSPEQLSDGQEHTEENCGLYAPPPLGIESPALALALQLEAQETPAEPEASENCGLALVGSSSTSVPRGLRAAAQLVENQVSADPEVRKLGWRHVYGEQADKLRTQLVDCEGQADKGRQARLREELDSHLAKIPVRAACTGTNADW